ncbi:type II secretion system F family protein [Microcella humidisoli]|uniref:Type II secretion system F family protein n=1 Tax=Microcella humidisoli TaxID=2963406 RepID=A0ABY5FY04_9MICO|nr:type II secretion system F family protein [Microcella humidisoli]UTT62750.1 type II secretion system F family protein [Microcella humidisoli]
MTPLIGAALLAGLGLGGGLWLLVSASPRIGRPRLASRLAPYLVDVSAEARAMTAARRSDPLPVLGALLAPVVESARGALDAVLGGEAIIRTRLRQSGSPLTFQGHRTRQLFGALLGAASGIALAILVARDGVPFVPAAIGAVAAGGIGGIAAVDALLAHAARRRSARIAEEFPTVVEFLALSVAAGESILEALRRVARTGSGELAGELDRVVQRAAAGQPLATALAEVRDDLAVPAVSRLIDQVLAALDRGTPLAEVLRAHALDARDESKRRLLEAAGTREVAMLVPLVMLILPVTVLFAVWPGLMVLQLGF